MKHEKFFSGLSACVLAAAVAIAGVGCVSSGFNLYVADGWQTTLYILAFTALAAVCFSLRRGPAVLAGLSVLAVLWNFRDLLLSVERLVYRISVYYHGGYGWDIIRWSTADLSTVSLVGALTLLGCAVAAAVCWTVCRRKWFGVGMLAGLLPLFLCCVVTDTVPDDLYILLLMIGLLLLSLTQQVRRQNPADGNRLTALLAVPVVLVCTLLFQVTSESTYIPQAQKLQEFLMELVDLGAGPGVTPNTGGSETGYSAGKVDLLHVGPQEKNPKKVLFVTTDFPGAVYLRGQAYDTYTGTSWEVELESEGERGWPIMEGVTGNVRVSTISTLLIRFFPYGIADSGWESALTDGVMLNPDQSNSYSYLIGDPVAGYTALDEEQVAAYTDLPEETRAMAEQIVSQIIAPVEHDMDTAEIARRIMEYVRSSAEYDLDTGRMPSGETDFAMWFLEESDTGYCVHFASAATVLLRAAGIPARYVTGYLTWCDGTDTTSVTEDMAHAWVEYLDDYSGWTVLEATPTAVESITPTETEPTEPPTTLPTDPSDTTVPTGPSDPTRPTQPDQTQPTQPQATTTPTTTEPSGNGGGSQGGSVNLEWLKWIAGILAVWGLLAGQRELRLRLRKKRLTSGGRNTQGLRRWRYARRLAWLTRRRCPKELRELAEKARFSQHKLTDEELSSFDRWIGEACDAVLKKPLPIKWLLQVLLAI